MRRLFICVSLLLGAAQVGALARTLEVGPGKPFNAPSAAIHDARDGDRILVQPGEYFDCAIVSANNLTIEGVGDPAQVRMTDRACGGKALLIAVGNNLTVRNLTLTRVRVPDGNGAGIRMEGKDLSVDRVHFVNNQEGILGGGIAHGTVRITNSVFDRDGACDGSCAHGIYLDGIDLLQVSHSQFTNIRKGHAIKSRAKRTEVTDCDFNDGPDGTESYEIEAPSGGSLLIRNNTIYKGPRAENHTAISIGAEGVDKPTRDILIEGNRFKNGGDYTAVFVDNRTATDAMLRGNTLEGSVEPLKGDGEVVATK